MSSSAESVMKSTEGLGVCSRRDSAHASASLDGGVSDIIVTCVHQSLHSSFRRRLESRNDLSSVKYWSNVVESGVYRCSSVR